MRSAISAITFVSLALGDAQAHAQFVKGNEAVQVRPDGTKHVETPPIKNPKVLGDPCPPTRVGCSPNAVRMVETSQGLMQCSEPYARPGACSPSTYGTEKRTRLWIVKKSGTWLQCQYPRLDSKCVPLGQLPYDAIQ